MSPFASRDWFACCNVALGPDRTSELWVLEDTAGPVGMIPLVREKRRLRGLPARVLRFLDSPDTPFMDLPLALPPNEAVPVFLEALRSRRDWDVLVLGKLAADSTLHKAFDLESEAMLPSRIAAVERSPFLQISGTWQEFFREQKTQRFRKTCRNIENRIRKEGAVTVEEHNAIDVDGALFAEVMDVARRSWKGPLNLSMATMTAMPRFFREFTQRASTNGWLRLWMLRVDGRAVATEYQISANGCVYALRADFDVAFADASPGAYLNMHIIQTLFEQGGVQEYDMGPGDNAYKLRWASGSHDTVTLELYAPTPYGRLLHAVETQLVPLARRVRAAAMAPLAAWGAVAGPRKDI